MAFIDELRTRLEKTKREWETAKKEAREAKAREARLYDDLSALERVLQSATSDSGRTAQVTVVPPAMTWSPTPNPAPEEESSKAEIVRRVIKQHSPLGLTPADLRAKLADQGHQMEGPYIYSILLRNKRAGKIRERNGKYFIDATDDLRAKAVS